MAKTWHLRKVPRVLAVTLLSVASITNLINGQIADSHRAIRTPARGIPQARRTLR